MHTHPGPVVVSRRHRAGFTLIELMVVLGIIGLSFGYSSWVVYKGLQKTDTKEAIYQLKGRLERARKLSMVAGNRLGTPTVVQIAGCITGPTPGLIDIDVNVGGQQIVIPLTMVPVADAGITNLNVTCDLFDPTTAKNGNWQIDAVSTTTNFSFGPTGSLINAPPGGVYLQFSNPATADIFGLHILSSGLICAASAPGVCDEDTGP